MVLALSENWGVDGFLCTVGLRFLEGVQFIEALDEQQVGQLFHHRERV